MIFNNHIIHQKMSFDLQNINPAHFGEFVFNEFNTQI